MIYATCQWGILVAPAKLGTPQMVGEFALALAVTAPILIGAGIPLVAPRHRDVSLRLRSSRKYPDGVVRLRYGVAR